MMIKLPKTNAYITGTNCWAENQKSRKRVPKGFRISTYLSFGIELFDIRLFYFYLHSMFVSIVLLNFDLMLVFDWKQYGEPNSLDELLGTKD